MTFMSSCHNPSHTTLVERKRVDGIIINAECPVSIVDYNKYMGGVDGGDQLRKYYHVHVKSRKSYKYIFWYLFEISVINSFILSLYSCNIPNSTYLSFRDRLATELIGSYNVRRRHFITKTVIHPHIIVNAPHYPCKAPCKRR